MYRELLQGHRLILLSLLASFAAVSAILITPALPDFASFFRISEGCSLLILSIYLFGFAFGVLYHSILANRFGRRSALLSGLSFSIISCILVLCNDLSDQFFLFCLLRLMQGIGASCSFIITLHMIGDTGEKGIPQAGFSLVQMFIVMIGLATFLGGLLTTYWEWESCYIFLTSYNALLFFLSFLLPETLMHRSERAISHTLLAYKKQFQDSFLLLHACLAGLSISTVYLFVGLAPFTAINELELQPLSYGLYSLIPYLGMSLGFYSWMRYAKKQSPRLSMLSGIFYSLLGCILMQIFFVNEIINWTFFICSAVVLLGSVVIYLSSTSVALGEASDRRSAFTILQFLVLLISAVAVFIVSMIPEPSLRFPLSAAIVMILALFLWIFLKAHHAHLKKGCFIQNLRRKKRDTANV